jgi:nucleotide-binding universal stress UspA family protein
VYRSLLVPLDGSSFAEQALPLALGIARKAGAGLQIVTVIAHHWTASLFSAQSLSQQAAIWRHYLENLAERASRECSMAVDSVVLDGAAVTPRLCAHAKEVAVDLFVMSTHSRAWLGRLWFGSVANELIHHLSIPVLFVRPDKEAITLSKEPVLQHILITLDGSLLAEQVLEPAVSLGTLVDAEYTLLRVVDFTPIGTPELDPISLSSAAVELLDEITFVRERSLKQAHSYLDGVAERLRVRGLRVQTKVMVADDAGAGILEAVATPSYDMVALATHGSRVPSDGLLGSVARKIMHGTSKPVLVQPVPTATEISP